MKKRILLGCLLVGQGYAATFNMIEQTAIEKARQTIVREIEAVHKKRLVIAGLGMAVLCAGIYGTCKIWLFEGEKMRAAGKRGAETAESVKTDSVEPSCGRIMRMWHWMGQQTNLAFNVAPVLAMSFFVNTTLSAGVGYMSSFASRLYRPLDWQWMMRERAPLVPLVYELKNCAAVLDQSSELFSLLTQVKINWDGPCTVMASDGWIQLSAFDDLIKLRMLSQKAPTDTRMVYEKQIEHIWNQLVDRLVQCLGFIAYKQQLGVECEFDAHQLTVMSDHVIASTNALAKQLPELMSAHNQQQSSGLLVAVYRYSTTLLHCCDLLVANTLVVG